MSRGEYIIIKVLMAKLMVIRRSMQLKTSAFSCLEFP